MSRQMNIVLAASKEYSRYAQITMVSLFENNRANEIHVFFFYHEQMPEEIEQMCALAHKYHQQFDAVYIDNKSKAFIQKYGNVDHASWYKWISIDHLAGECDRILVLGADLFIKKDISSFYFQDMREKGMALIPDMGVMDKNSVIHSQCGLFSLESTEYVNSDVCLIDLKKMSGRLSLKKMLEYYRKNIEKFPFLEQDVLNAFYHNDMYICKDYRYNFLAYVAEECLTEKQTKKMLSEAAVVHFAGGKPWKYFKGLPSERQWLEYAKKTQNYVYMIEQILSGTSEYAKAAAWSAVKNRANYKIADRMLSGVEKGSRLKTFFKDREIHVIGIYGAGKLCSHLLWQIENMTAVAYIIDKDPAAQLALPHKVIPIQELGTQSPVDAIIVTPVFAFEEIKEELRKRCDAKVISLLELYNEDGE